MHTDLFISHLEEGSELFRKHIIENNPIWSNFRATVYGDNIDNCMNHCIAAKWSIQCRLGKDESGRCKSYQNQIIYESSNKRVYVAILQSFYCEDKYADSFNIYDPVLIYDSVVDSFQTYKKEDGVKMEEFVNVEFSKYKTMWDYTNTPTPKRVYNICSTAAGRQEKYNKEEKIINFYIECMDRELECYNWVTKLHNDKDINDLPDYAQEKWDNGQIGYCAIKNFLK